MYGTFHK